MNSLQPSDYPSVPPSGIALVEVLVAMALGLLLTIGITNIFLSTKQSYRTEESMSRNQENGRFATDYLTRDIRMAGFIGCGNLEDVVPNTVATDPPVTSLTLNTALLGYDGNRKNGTGDTWTNTSSISHVSGTDIIIVNHGGSCNADLTTKMGAIGSDIQVELNNCGFKANDTLLVTDCRSADLLRATSVATGGTDTTIGHKQQSPGNTTDDLSKAYDTDASVLSFRQSTYFIGLSPTGNPSLYRISGGALDELVENIQDLQFVYGLDAGSDGIVDSFDTALNITDWSKVLSVRIGLLIRSRDNATVQPHTIVFNGSTLNSGAGADHRMRSVIDTTIGIRNRLP